MFTTSLERYFHFRIIALLIQSQDRFSAREHLYIPPENIRKKSAISLTINAPGKRYDTRPARPINAPNENAPVCISRALYRPIESGAHLPLYSFVLSLCARVLAVLSAPGWRFSVISGNNSLVEQRARRYLGHSINRSRARTRMRAYVRHDRRVHIRNACAIWYGTLYAHTHSQRKPWSRCSRTRSAPIISSVHPPLIDNGSFKRRVSHRPPRALSLLHCLVL